MTCISLQLQTFYFFVKHRTNSQGHQPPHLASCTLPPAPPAGSSGLGHGQASALRGRWEARPSVTVTRVVTATTLVVNTSHGGGVTTSENRDVLPLGSSHEGPAPGDFSPEHDVGRRGLCVAGLQGRGRVAEEPTNTGSRRPSRSRARTSPSRTRQQQRRRARRGHAPRSTAVRPRRDRR